MSQGDASKTPAAVVSDLVDWSTKLPVWQRDALRRLYQNLSLAPKDKSELLTLCREEAGLSISEPKITAEPLSKDHVPTGANTSETVTLRSLRNAKHVNALVANQSLGFRENGLTIVYGDNGAGKSGYSRILKKVCRARASEVILANVYESQESQPATAAINFCVNATEESYDWEDGITAHLLLSRISLFDAQCAPIHVNEKYEAAYIPLPLQVLQSLANLCKDFRDNLKAKRDMVALDVPTWKQQPKFDETTAAGTILQSVNSQTSLEDVKRLSLNSDEQKRLEDLRLQFKQAPDKVIRIEQSKHLRLSQLVDRVERLQSTFSDESINSYKNKIIDAETKSEAARVAATEAFKDDPLPDKIGTETWRELWTAARNFAEEVYPGFEFPNVEKDAVCVLCQQNLAPEAVDRFTRFAKFVRQDTRRRADTAISERTKARTTLEIVRLEYPQRLQDMALLKNEIGRPDLANAIRRFYRHIILRRGRVLAVEKSAEWPTLSVLPDSSIEQLKQLFEQTKTRIKELGVAAESEGLKKLQ